MHYWIPVIVLFSMLILGITLGLPISFTLGSSAVIGAVLFMGTDTLGVVAQNIYGVMRNLILIAVPLFVFMAYVLQESGVAEDLFMAMHQWFGPLRGGLAIAIVAICTLIAAMSGVSQTGTVTMGVIALPILLRKGYAKSIALGPIMAGGALAMLIPPSVVFVIYGMLAQVSIGKLFAGGVIPGLMLSISYMIYIGVRCYFQPQLGPTLSKEERVSLREKIFLSRNLILPIFLIIGVLGSIFFGVASPTEASAIGALGAVICGAVHRRLSWKLVREACYGTAKVAGMCLWILFGALSFSAVFIATGGPHLVQGFFSRFPLPPMLIIFFMELSYFILGCFVDEITMLLITIPVYMPILQGLGFDVVWFGVLFLVNMQMAALTPPFGCTLFWLKGVAPPGVSTLDLYRSIGPFIAIQWVMLLLLMFFPQLALWLPNVVFGLK